MIEIISNILDNNGRKLEISYNKKNQNHSNTWKLNNMLLNNEWVTNELKEEIRNYLETHENEHTTTPNLWDTAKAVLRENFLVLQDLRHILK